VTGKSFFHAPGGLANIFVASFTGCALDQVHYISCVAVRVGWASVVLVRRREDCSFLRHLFAAEAEREVAWCG